MQATMNSRQTVNGINLTPYKLDDLLSAKQLSDIIKRWTKTHRYSLETWVLKKATEGLAGYLGDHLRLTVGVQLDDGRRQEIKLFIKCIPNSNQPKVDFLKSNRFYEREQLVINELLKDVGGYEEINPWRPEVYICNEEIVIMPDMAVSGYTMRDKMLYFDLEHCILTLTSLAKYHAASVNYETKKSKIYGDGYRIIDEFPDVLRENNFIDSPWLRAGARTATHFLGNLSTKYNYKSEHYKVIEDKLEGLYIEACETVKINGHTVNVVIHKDLWSNNILFKYTAGKPVNAVLLDFQCVQYAPAALDVTIFLYLNTSRKFREAHERQVLQHYYESFIGQLNIASASRLKGYTFETFLGDVELSRSFGLLVPMMIFPYIIMDPLSAKKNFDDPITYEFYNNVDRTAPVLAQARKDKVYRDKLLQVYEEFVENFIL